MSTMKRDMSSVCMKEFHNRNPYEAMFAEYLTNDIISELFDTWYDSHCGRCIFMNEICMYGEGGNQDYMTNYINERRINVMEILDMARVCAICGEKEYEAEVTYTNFWICPKCCAGLKDLIISKPAAEVKGIMKCHE